LRCYGIAHHHLLAGVEHPVSPAQQIAQGTRARAKAPEAAVATVICISCVSR
jgi:hypothetical protein